MSDTSESDKEEGCTASPRMQRKKKRKQKGERGERWPYKSEVELEQEDLSYMDTLPEVFGIVYKLKMYFLLLKFLLSPHEKGFLGNCNFALFSTMFKITLTFITTNKTANLGRVYPCS